MAWPSLLPSLLLRYEYLVNALLEPSYRQLILYRASPSHTHGRHYSTCKLEVCIWRIHDTLTFNFFLGIFNCTPRFAYELWPDETNKLIKRFRKLTKRAGQKFLHVIRILASHRPKFRYWMLLLITQICMPFRTFTFGRTWLVLHAQFYM